MRPSCGGGFHTFITEHVMLLCWLFVHHIQVVVRSIEMWSTWQPNTCWENPADRQQTLVSHASQSQAIVSKVRFVRCIAVDRMHFYSGKFLKVSRDNSAFPSPQKCNNFLVITCICQLIQQLTWAYSKPCATGMFAFGSMLLHGFCTNLSGWIFDDGLMNSYFPLNCLKFIPSNEFLTIKSSRFAVRFWEISRLGSAFIFVRWFKLVHMYIIGDGTWGSTRG